MTPVSRFASVRVERDPCTVLSFDRTRAEGLKSRLLDLRRLERGRVGFDTLPEQYRLIWLAPQTQDVVLSLNASSIYLGQGIGAGLGSLASSTALWPLWDGWPRSRLRPASSCCSSARDGLRRNQSTWGGLGYLRHSGEMATSTSTGTFSRISSPARIMPALVRSATTGAISSAHSTTNSS